MPTKTKTKQRCCIHCGKPFPPRTRRDKQFCNDACRKAAERRELNQENGELRRTTRLKQRRSPKHPLETLRSSKFIQWLIHQIQRHGSLDCLGQNFDIEDIFHLYRLKARISFKTNTPCDASHLVPCRNGGSFTLDNLVILPMSINRSQKDKVIPPPTVGETFNKTTTCTDEVDIWQQLVTRYRKQLTLFAERHKNLKGSGKADAINKLLDTPGTPYVYRATLQGMEETKFQQLCESLNIPYRPTSKDADGYSDEDANWHPSFIAHKFLHDVYQRCPKRLYETGKQILKILHLQMTFLTEQECNDIYYWRFDKALSSLRKRVAQLLKLTEEQLMNHIDHLNSNDLFITAERNGLRQHIMVINGDTPDEADQRIFESAEFQQALRSSQERLRITKQNLNVINQYVSKYGGSRFQAMCKLRWKAPHKRGDVARYLECHELDIFNNKRPLPEEVATFNRWKQCYAN